MSSSLIERQIRSRNRSIACGVTNTRARPGAVRLVGVALSKLSLEEPQLKLATFDEGDRRGEAVDKVREKFGYDAVHLATTIFGNS